MTARIIAARSLVAAALYALSCLIEAASDAVSPKEPA